jgi:hypothetical protein
MAHPSRATNAEALASADCTITSTRAEILLATSMANTSNWGTVIENISSQGPGILEELDITEVHRKRICEEQGDTEV